MTTSQSDEPAPSSAPGPTFPRASQRPSSDPVSRRLAELEARLARLEDETGPPAAVAHRLSRRLDALEAREHHHAKAVAHLEGRLAQLLADQVSHPESSSEDAAGVGASTSSNRSAAVEFPPRPKRSLARRALDGLHYLRYVWRRLRGDEEGSFPDQSLEEVLEGSVQELPSLGLVVLCEESTVEDGAVDEALQAALRHQTAESIAHVIYDPASERLGNASPGFWSETPSSPVATALTQANPDYLVTLRLEELEQWPATLAECLQLALALEVLDVLEVLLSPTLRVLVQRRRDWHPQAHRSVQNVRGKVGKIVNLSSAPVAALLDGDFERRFGPYRFATAGSTLTRRRLEPAPSNTKTGEGSCLVLADDLLNGREQLFSDLFLRLPPSPWILVGEDDDLSRQRLAQLQRLRRLDGEHSLIYALGAMIPAPLRLDAVSWLARRWKATGLIPIAFPEEIATTESSHASPSMALAAGLADSITMVPPPSHHGALLCASNVTPPGSGNDAGDLALDSLRRQLGWQGERPVVLWFGDLLAERRPEAFLALAQRCPTEADFLMVGRGPLEGSVDDLARFLDLGNFRRLPSLPLALAIGLSDVVCTTAPRDVLPYALIAAHQSAKRLLLPEGSELATALVDGNRGRTFPLDEPDSACEALLELLKAVDPISQAERLVSTWPSLQEVDAAWRHGFERSAT